MPGDKRHGRCSRPVPTAWARPIGSASRPYRPLPPRGVRAVYNERVVSPAPRRYASGQIEDIVSTETFKSPFLRELAGRGFIHQVSEPELLDEAARRPIVAYIGFDCTRPSLDIGSLVQIMMLHWMQRCGHRPIVVMGGGTTRIGDPSARTARRASSSPTMRPASTTFRWRSRPQSCRSSTCRRRAP